VHAADELAKDRFGAASLREGLGRLVDCHGVSERVAAECIDPPGPGRVCVDHAAEIEQLCSMGLDLVVSSVEAQMKALDTGIALANGVAELWDAPAPDGPLDAVADRVDHGFWTANYTVGTNTTPFVTTFTGKRLGDH
jgi:hypothetical protein